MWSFKKQKSNPNPKTYDIDIQCANCSASELVEIPFGTTVLEFLETYSEKCGICGCCDWRKDPQGDNEVKKK